MEDQKLIIKAFAKLIHTTTKGMYVRQILRTFIGRILTGITMSLSNMFLLTTSTNFPNPKRKQYGELLLNGSVSGCPARRRGAV